MRGRNEDEDVVEMLPLPLLKREYSRQWEKNTARKKTPQGRKFYYRKENTHIMKRFWENREFWKDALLVAGATLAFYIIYVVIAYWSNIVEGFSRGWNGQ